MPYLVGQRVLFDWEPDGTLHTHQQWEFVCPRGAVIADYVANSSAGNVVPLPLDGGNRGDTTGSGLVTYWTTEGQFPFRSILTYNTQTHAGLHAHKGYPEDPPEQVDIVAPTVAAATLIDRTPVVDGVLLKPFILYQPGSDRAFVKMGERREPNPLHKVGFLACVDVTVDLDPFPDARPDFRFVQLGTVRFDYTTRDGRHLTVDTHVADPALDTRFPYPGDPPEEVGPATWQVLMDDSPEFPLPSRGFSAASASFQFAAYVMFRPYPDGRWVALGRVNWNADITVAKASDAAPWTITSQNRGRSPWIFDNDMPRWTANMCTAGTEMQIKLGIEGMSKKIFIPPILAALTRLADYRMYSVKARSGAQSQDFVDRFESQAQANLVPSGPGEFRGWLLPEDIERARSLTDVAYLGDVSPSDKYRHEKGDYIPPFDVNDTWDIAVAPLCFARPGQADDQAYWELFSDLTPATMIAAMQSVLPGVTVSCSGMIAAYGVFRMTFSRAPSEQDILAIAGINWVSFINPHDTIPVPEPYADPVLLADGMIITLGQPWYATRWLDGNTIAGVVGLTTSLDAAHSGAEWYVQAHGNDVFSFRCLGREARPEHVWLDGNTIGGQVTLVPDLGPSRSGARWKAIRRGENRYTLECLGSYDNPRMRVLSSAGGVVELRPAATITQPSTIWRVTANSIQER